MYIRKNHLTIGTDSEIFEIVSNDGNRVHWFGSESELAALLGTDAWQCNDSIIDDGNAFFALAEAQ